MTATRNVHCWAYMLPSLFTFCRTPLIVSKIIMYNWHINSWITVIHQKPVKQECINPGRQVVVATKFCTLTPNIFGSSVWNMLHVTILVPKILRWLLCIWKICASVLWKRSTSQEIPRHVPILNVHFRVEPMKPILKQVHPVHIHFCLIATVMYFCYLLPGLPSGRFIRNLWLNLINSNLI
jgi:hypothetical protein